MTCTLVITIVGKKALKLLALCTNKMLEVMNAFGVLKRGVVKRRRRIDEAERRVVMGGREVWKLGELHDVMGGGWCVLLCCGVSVTDANR